MLPSKSRKYTRSIDLMKDFLNEMRLLMELNKSAKTKYTLKVEINKIILNVKASLIMMIIMLVVPSAKKKLFLMARLT